MKNVKKIAAILLSLVMLVALSACSLGNKDEAAIVGTWQSDPIDISDAITDSIAGEDEETAACYDFSGLNIIYTMEFNADKTFKMYIDDECKNEFAAKFHSDLAKGVENQFNLVASQNEMSVADILSASGYTDVEDFITKEMGDIDQQMIDSFETSEGQFALANGQLFTTDDVNYRPATENGEPYTLEGDTLTIDAGAADGEDVAYLFPMVLHRVAAAE